MRADRNLCGCRSGAVAVEFALVLPVLALLAAGLLDLGQLVYTQERVAMAARAGAQFGLSYPYDVAGITNAVTTATQDNTIALQSTAKFCTCGASSAAQQSSSVCSGQTANPCGGPLYFYVSVTAQQTTSNPLSYMGLGFLSSKTFTSTAVLEAASVCPASGQGQASEQC